MGNCTGKRPVPMSTRDKENAAPGGSSISVVLPCKKITIEE